MNVLHYQHSKASLMKTEIDLGDGRVHEMRSHRQQELGLSTGVLEMPFLAKLDHTRAFLVFYPEAFATESMVLAYFCNFKSVAFK